MSELRAHRGAAGAVSLACALAIGCGGAERPGADRTESRGDFECNGRRASYQVLGGFVAAEAGVSMECEGGQPRIVKWHSDEGGEPIRIANDLSADQFDDTWEKIDSTGWRFLARDCGGKAPRKGKRRAVKRATGGAGDPTYTIEVGDAATAVSLRCNGVELPFPYDRLVNELDLRAAGFGDDAGRPL